MPEFNLISSCLNSQYVNHANLALDVGVHKVKSKTAISNLRIVGYLFTLIGILGIIGSMIFWGDFPMIVSMLKILGAIAFLYFGFLILSSIAALKDA